MEVERREFLRIDCLVESHILSINENNELDNSNGFTKNISASGVLFRTKKKAKKKIVKKKGGKKKAFGGYMIYPDAKLGAVIGNKPMPPSKMTKAIWTYIKKHSLGKKK